MFIVTNPNGMADEFATGETIAEAYNRICSAAGEMLDPEELGFYEANPIKVKMTFEIDPTQSN